MRRIKKFNEAEEWIYGSPGIPGQPSRKEGEEDYLSKIWNKRKEQIRQQGPGIFDLKGSAQAVRGHEIELETLLEKVFTNIYKGLVERYNIKFDIKFADQRNIGSLLNIKESLESEKYKRKLINLVGQGEAKNMMYVFHNEEFKQGIYDIFGEDKGKKLINLWTEIVKSVDYIDVNRPINSTWNSSFVKSSVGGACKISWKKNEDLNEDFDDYTLFMDDEENDEDNDNKNDKNDNDVDYLLMKALKNGDFDEAEEIQKDNKLPESYIRDNFTPVITSRGIDFTMLIHEAIKGLYLVLSIIGLPKEKQMAKLVLNKGYAIREEPEEFKWGPMIAADLRDFINESPKLTDDILNKYTNIREQFWIYMLKLPADEFLELFRMILNKSEEANIKRDSILKIIISKLHNHYENKRLKAEYEAKKRKYEEDLKKYEEDLNKWEEKQKAKQETPISKSEPKIEQKPDYANMRQKELNDLLNAAIDRGDYQTASEISQYIK